MSGAEWRPRNIRPSAKPASSAALRTISWQKNSAQLNPMGSTSMRGEMRMPAGSPGARSGATSVIHLASLLGRMK
eukprot:8261068-Pyramimonas_sp.AAC.1